MSSMYHIGYQSEALIYELPKRIITDTSRGERGSHASGIRTFKRHDWMYCVMVHM